MKKINLVLVVDDNRGDHIISKFVIEEFDQNIQVLSAYDGKQALEILSRLENAPQAILLDINMPGMDGLDFLQEYSRNPKQSTVIAMLTSSNQYSDREKCLSYDFVKKYIIKPLEKQDLESLAELLS